MVPKAPDPLPSTACICGSPWVAEYAAPMIAGMVLCPDIASARVSSKDSFHDVSDVHPFHLPHIFNTCKSGQGKCSLNMTTVTMPIAKAGPLFPNISSAPLSAFELRTKLKSRASTWEAAGGPGSAAKNADKNMTMYAHTHCVVLMHVRVRPLLRTWLAWCACVRACSVRLNDWRGKSRTLMANDPAVHLPCTLPRCVRL